MRWLATLVLLGAGLPAQSTLTGDWTGWAYQTGGGDYPLRLRVRGDGSGLRGSVDLPAHRRGGIPAPVREVGSRITVRPEGLGLSFEGELAGDTIAGSCRQGGRIVASFELHRSPMPLAVVDPGDYQDCVGSYRLTPERVVIVDRRFWGELLYQDTVTGRRGTLFPLSRDVFFAGSAMYVPGPATARVEFLRDGSGEVTALWWQDAGGEPVLAPRAVLREEQLGWTSGDVELRGTLVRPEGPGPHRAVVVLGGSSWRVRDDVRRRALIWASAGIAALIYDKRGHGESGGQPDVPFSTTADDAVAAVRALLARPEIADVGMTGTSRGGWLAPLAVTRSKDIAFLVLFVPPAVSPARQEHTRRLNEMRSAGFSPTAVQEASAYLDELWRFARTAEDPERYRRAWDRARGEAWFELVAGVPPDGDWRWSRANMHFDPVPVLEQVRVPVLAMFAGADRNVVPEENLPVMRAALARAGSDATLLVVSGADHGFRRVPPDGRRPPLHRLVGQAPEVWSTAIAWVLDR